MVTDADISALRREIAQLRGELASFRSEAGMPGETLASLAGRIRDTLARHDLAIGILQVAAEMLQYHDAGQPWQHLTLPAGATGTARFRAAPGGHAQIQLALDWKTPPAVPAVLYGLHRDLWPSRPWTHTQDTLAVTVALNGSITLTGVTGPVAGNYLVPRH